MASRTTNLNCSCIRFTTKASPWMLQCMKEQFSGTNFILVSTPPCLRVIAQTPPEQKPTHFFKLNPFSTKKWFNFLNFSSAVVRVDGASQNKKSSLIIV